MRQIMQRAEAGDDLARLAIKMYCYRIKKYIGAYCAVLGRVDALVFTGGIGENAADIRTGACRKLAYLGIEVDQIKNNTRSDEIFEIQSNNSSVKVLVIRTNEELEIAQQTVERILTVARA